MGFDRALKDLISDLPWVDNVRIVVGPYSSREVVKDLILEHCEILPEWAVGTLPLFASELAARARGRRLERPLSAASRCDALESIARNDLLKNAIPDLCAHLRSRAVAEKIARFITELDRFYTHEAELDAINEYFAAKEPGLGAFAKVLAALWHQGELQPWGDGAALRAALEALKAHAVERLPERVWLWGFSEFTPLEEALLEALVQAGVKLYLFVPEAAAPSMQEGAGRFGLDLVALPSGSKLAGGATKAAHTERKFWEPHSVWDELEFLRDELARLRAQGVPWSELAVFVPKDDTYKRLCRDKLQSWNVPIQDPTLTGAWKERPRWLWWRDFFNTLASGLKLDDVRAWLGPGASHEELFIDAYKSGVHGAASQWAKLLEKHSGLSELQLLVQSAAIFSRSMTPHHFREACEKLVPLAEKLFSTDATSAGALETELILEFARHLCEERPYLANFRARLPKYVALFEEYLESRSRQLSARVADGLSFVAHGVHLPRSAKYAFVLGLNMVSRPRRTVDVWEWEGVEVRRAWEKMHLGVSWEDRVRRDEAYFLWGIEAHVSCTFSAIAYDLSGNPVPKPKFYEFLKGEAQLAHEGGHPSVGWVSTIPEAATTAHLRHPGIAERVTAAPLAVSAFEDYLKCPFLYFARHILKLAEEEELGLDANALARGTILHRVLERWLSEELKGHEPKDLEQARNWLEAIVDEEIGKLTTQGRSLPGMYRHKPLVAKTVRVIKAQVGRWLDWEFENRAKHPELKPFAVEMPIEFELHGPELGAIRFRGKVDRVDSDGTHCVVIDYKSGDGPFIGKELLSGSGAQLMMYSQAVANETGLKPAAAFYLTVGRKVEGKKGVFLKKHKGAVHSAHHSNSGLYDGDFETLFEQVTENWLQAAVRLKNGDFQPRPLRSKDCQNCSYQNICGHQELSPEEGQAE